MDNHPDGVRSVTIRLLPGMNIVVWCVDDMESQVDFRLYEGEMKHCYLEGRPGLGDEGGHCHAIPLSYILIVDDMILRLDILVRMAAGEELVA